MPVKISNESKIVNGSIYNLNFTGNNENLFGEFRVIGESINSKRNVVIYFPLCELVTPYKNWVIDIVINIDGNVDPYNVLREIIETEFEEFFLDRVKPPLGFVWKVGSNSISRYYKIFANISSNVTKLVNQDQQI